MRPFDWLKLPLVSFGRRCQTAILLSNSVPSYLSICLSIYLCVSAHRFSLLQMAAAVGQPAAACVAYCQTAGVCNIFPSALCTALHTNMSPHDNLSPSCEDISPTSAYEI